MKNIVIFGGSGFIGRHLMNELGKDYQFLVLSRDPAKLTVELPANAEAIKISFSNRNKLIPYFEQADGIVNLAGENVSGRWTEDKMREIEYSRMKIDRLILNTFEMARHNIRFVIQGSGMGVYGFSRNKMEIDEDAKLGRHGFLTKIGYAHEKSMRPLQDKTRLVYIRTGIVLDGKEGALPKMAKPFNFKLGGPLGSGKQWNSWIHIKDEVRAIRFLIENETSKGAYNLTAPNAVRQAEFAQLLGEALGKPSFLRKPSFLLRMMLGKMADELILRGLNIKPKRLLEEGFTFNFNTLEEALLDIYGSHSTPK
ncbi:MAG: TIGR01777 family oxidoreductase [Bacteroidales bacterium]|nr:TIGR01777 family oxidoreductase [Bacteroidales bacterium]